MVRAPAAPFRFDFEDLRPPATDSRSLDLRVVGGRAPLPESASLIEPAAQRPRWLPRLLPVFAADRPFHVEVAGGGTFAGLLLESLGAILATAGAEAGLHVVQLGNGVAVGCPPLDRLPAAAHAILFPADLTRASVATALEAARSCEASLVVLNGCLPRLDRHLGLDTSQPLVRLPLIGRRELEAVRRGLPAGLAGRRLGVGCVELARRLVAIYRDGLD